MRIALAALALLLCAPSAMATTYRYATSNNRIYVEGGGTTTLTTIAANLPDAAAGKLTNSGGTWLLAAELWLRDGSRLDLHGTAVGGDVDALRLKSDASGFIYISAEYGRIDIDSTKIQSWDPGAGAVDTNYGDGRAYIRVRSYLDADGVTPRESRMDIRNSELGYLGYNAAEAYGLTWKVIGSPGSNFELFDKVNVYGDITGSRMHHNYYGMYTYGHEGGQWTNNEADHNVMYGFDPHDDSDHLLIENNNVHDNGWHGIIASKRCDHVIIRNNRSYSNVGNGIMLHRSSNDGIIEDNETYLNDDSGIALYANQRTIVRNNVALDNGASGIRLSMGEADSKIENNEFGNSGKYGIYFYKGNDEPEPGDDGRPKRNSFTGNKIHDSGAEAIKMSDSDGNSFTSTVITGDTKITVASGANNKFNKSTLPSGFVISVSGTADFPGSVDLYNHSVVGVSFGDSYGTARFRDNSRSAFDPSQALYTKMSTSSSLLTLTKANTGGSSTVTKRALTATPASGTISVDPTSWNTSGDRSKAWKTLASSSSVSIAYTVGNLASGVPYDVKRNGSTIGTYTANSSGAIAFSHAPGSTSAVTYSVVPH